MMNHDWVTSNGITPMSRTIYPKVELTKNDTVDLFKSVWIISKIKLKIRNQIEKRRRTVLQGKRESIAHGNILKE